MSDRIRSMSGLAFRKATLSLTLGRMAFISMGSSSSDSTETSRSALMASSSIITIDIIGFRSSEQGNLYNKKFFVLDYRDVGAGNYFVSGPEVLQPNFRRSHFIRLASKVVRYHQAVSFYGYRDMQRISFIHFIVLDGVFDQHLQTGRQYQHLVCSIGNLYRQCHAIF